MPQLHKLLLRFMEQPAAHGDLTLLPQAGDLIDQTGSVPRQPQAAAKGQEHCGKANCRKGGCGKGEFSRRKQPHPAGKEDKRPEKLE